MADLDGSAFLIPYEHIYHNVFHNIRPLYFFLVALWLVVLFYGMFTIADKHFTGSLGLLSKLLRLSPDLAGLTLLAFGNGAPDFFTAVFGAGEEPEMILGSSVGSGLFIITVVFGMVLLVAKDPGKGKFKVTESAAKEADTELGEDGIFRCSKARHSVQPFPFIRGTLMYLLCICGLCILSLVRSIPFWIPLILLSLFFIYLATVIVFSIKFKNPRRSTSSSIMIDDAMVQDRQKAQNFFRTMRSIERLLFSIKKTVWRSEWNEDILSRSLRSALIVVRSPIDLLFNITVLPVECPEEIVSDAKEYVSLRYLHRLRCIVNPFFSFFMFIFLLWSQDVSSYSWHIWAAYACSSVLTSIILFCTTSSTSPPSLMSLHIIYSFATCILWIYALSNELLSCLSSLGHIMGISPTVLGIIVLAWGNSFGDLVADIAIAKNGSLETALTAIFSGPVQNVLLTIGASFLIAALRSPTKTLSMQSLRMDIYVGLGLVFVILIMLLLLVPFKYDFCIPRTLGFALLVIYLCYLPIATILGLNLI